MNNQEIGDEVRISDVLFVFWSGKKTIIASTLAGLLISAGLYFSSNKIYETNIDITPLRQADYARFVGLNAAEIFPYSREALFDEFTSFIKYTPILDDAARVSGLIGVHSLDDDAQTNAASDFVRSVDFSLPAKDQKVLRIRVRATDRVALDKFIMNALLKANSEFSHQAFQEIDRRLTSDTERRIASILRLQVDMDARRKAEQSQASDRIAILTEQANIARSLGIDRPPEIAPLQASPATGDKVSVQVNSAVQPTYFQGFIALEEQIRQARERKNSEPFVQELRDLQRQEYVIRNDPNPARQQQLLKESGLNDAVPSPLVHYDLGSAAARKIFPSASVFGPAGLVLGFILGMGIVLVRSGRRRE